MMKALRWRRRAVTALSSLLDAHLIHYGVDWVGETRVDPYELQKAVKDGWLREGIQGWRSKVVGPGHVILLPAANLVTNTGVNRGLDQTFISGTASATNIIDSIGVDNGTVNPTSSTALSADGNSTSRTIIAFSPAASRSGQQVTAGGTFTNSNVSFVMKRLFLNRSTTDASGNLYAMTNVFTIDMTSFTSWSQSFTPTITGTGS